MASTDSENALTPIGKGVYISRPIGKGDTGRAAAESQPTIILVFGWMGAKLPHLLKYIKVYDEIYPDATKVLVRSEVVSFMTRFNARKAKLAPVVEVLEALGCTPSDDDKPIVDGAPIEPVPAKPPPRILIHTFSNGGSWELATLSNIFRERYEESGYPQDNLPPTAVVLDSCPGTGGLEATQNAFSLAVRHPILRRLVNVLITVMYFLNYIVERVFGGKGMLTIMREVLNRHRLLPYFSKATPRLYIYSTKDELISHTDVENHAEDAKKVGLETRLLQYTDSPHVAHARADPVRYWDAVKQLWDDARQKHR